MVEIMLRLIMMEELVVVVGVLDSKEMRIILAELLNKHQVIHLLLQLMA
tara:strand:- start:448 stop:594 length:147 start_codon:yes stop_codon:yes gene_type:complete